MNINLKELSEKSGKSEVDIAKTILILLAIKAEVFDKPQKAVLTLEVGDKNEKRR